MRIARTMASLLLAGALAMASGTAAANGHGTPDGETPAQEPVCDHLLGAAFGLCVAFCEANDCDESADPDDRACSTLRERYARTTGDVFLPCESGGDEIPQ